MALIKCPDCGKKISDKATACIHCGCPVSYMIVQKKPHIHVSNIEGINQKKQIEYDERYTGCSLNSEKRPKRQLKLWQIILICFATAIVLTFVAIALSGKLSKKDDKVEYTQNVLNEEDGGEVIKDTDNSNSGDDVGQEKTYIANGCFTFSPRSFIMRFDESDENTNSYKYTYMRMNGEDLLFYELAEISGGYENVKSVGMVSFVKDTGTTLAIEDDFSENIISKITVLVADVDYVPSILVGCVCAIDPSLDFTSAYNVSMKAAERAGTEEGYTYNGVNYVIAMDDGYYYIIISIATTSQEDTTDSSTNDLTSSELPNHTTAKLNATKTELFLDGTSELVYFYVNPSNIDAIIEYKIANPSIVECQRGGWDGNTAQLLFIPVSSGETTVIVYIDGYEGCSIEINISAYVEDGVSSRYDFDGPFITSTESEFWLEGVEGVTYITVYNITGEYSLLCDIEGANVVDCVWGDWEGDSIPLTLIPLESGNAFVTVYIDGYYSNSAITLPVFVP